jgi:hypothetical protein
MPRKSLESVENREQFLSDLEDWLKVEAATRKRSAEVQKKTRNPLINMVAEIIRRDSKTHIEVLNLIKESLTKKAIALTPDELAEIWDLLDGHRELEQKSVDMAERALRDSRIFVIRHLLTYLLEDESKHLKLLNQLEDFKRKIYPYL